MDAEGWAKSIVTGKKFSIDFKGKRSVGDPGNDYIAGLAMKMGKDVMTKFEWTMVSGAKLEGIVVINVTTPGGGDTTAADALEFTATLYGKPTFTPARQHKEEEKMAKVVDITDKLTFDGNPCLMVKGEKIEVNAMHLP